MPPRSPLRAPGVRPGIHLGFHAGVADTDSRPVYELATEGRAPEIDSGLIHGPSYVDKEVATATRPSAQGPRCEQTSGHLTGIVGRTLQNLQGRSSLRCFDEQ